MQSIHKISSNEWAHGQGFFFFFFFGDPKKTAGESNKGIFEKNFKTFVISPGKKKVRSKSPDLNRVFNQVARFEQCVQLGRQN